MAIPTDVIKVPSLSAKGWIGGLSEKADLLISHFFVSDAYQSELYEGVANCQVIFQQYMHDIEGLKEALRSRLEQYLGRYYQRAEVTVKDDTDTNKSNRISLIIYCDVTEGGRQYSFANLLSIVDSKFEKIARYNNTGTLT